MIPKKFLYIYTITTEGGVAGIERLREALTGAQAIRAKAFIRNDKTFVVHTESPLSALLTESGFQFSFEALEIGEEINL
ncbi:MAG: hypothetical protein A2676_05975 [Candidatus Sungbacteria bacterium RIFCSPHIGHO2_01_FULL_51_22]|nr:MAG: hypothetical protein A2676_05975 [Candidatus Sungbacteria bacterium RIFCSPHIGHO2_01_FULL_51_22]